MPGYIFQTKSPHFIYAHSKVIYKHASVNFAKVSPSSAISSVLKWKSSQKTLCLM